MLHRAVGVTAFGGYIPPLRIRREEMLAANAWMASGVRPRSNGERSLAGWDEDVVTMAVDAARDCLSSLDRSTLAGVVLGSTTLPFADRLNSGIVTAALGLPESAFALDITGSQRAGINALQVAFDAASVRGQPVLAIAAERRPAAVGTANELDAGHGAAAVMLGSDSVVARLLGSASLNIDFVDHFRASDAEFDYQWEQRWVRDEGYLKIVPRAIKAALGSAGIAASDVNHFCLSCSLPRVDIEIARAVGVSPETVRDYLSEGCGHTGSAHTIMMLVCSLESAQPGEVILVASFGHGSDCYVFEVTEDIIEYRERGTGVKKWLDRRSSCSYPRYLALSNLVKIDRGPRAEADKSTPLAAMFRHRDLLNGFVGGECTRCGTHQIPRLRICVNPDCRAVDSQVAYSFAESNARVLSWSADSLTFTPDPPAYYGILDFAEGGRLMMDFSNVSEAGVKVGMPMRMVFRVKEYDDLRRFTRYFWKATPVEGNGG